MASANPSATTTIMISSSSEPDADEGRFKLVFVIGSRGLAGLGLLDRGGPFAAGGAGGFGLGQRPLIDCLARHLGVGGRSGRRGLLRRGIVQQARLDDLLGPRVATL